MIDREFLRQVVTGPYAHRHTGFGYRLHFNRIRYPGALIEAVGIAHAGVGDLFGPYAAPSAAPIDVWVRSVYPRADEPRGAYLSPRIVGRPGVYLNLHNKDRIPLDSVFFWHWLRAVAAHEFGHAYIDRVTGGAPLPTWMDEGTARFVERSVVDRLRPGGALPEPGSFEPTGDDPTYRAGHEVVRHLVALHGLGAWFECLREAGGYLARKRTRMRRTLREIAEEERPAYFREQRILTTRRIDRLLVERFGFDRGELVERIARPRGTERPAESATTLDDAPFDRLVVGRLDAGDLGRASIAVALLHRSTYQTAPVATCVARTSRGVERLRRRADRERLPIHESAVLALRLGTGRRLHSQIPEHMRTSLLASTAGVERAGLVGPERAWLVHGVRGRGAIVAKVEGVELAVYLGIAAPARGRRLAEERVVEPVAAPNLLERIESTMVRGECLPTSQLRALEQI